MHILVTGAAGYIGSHVVKQLSHNSDNHITIIDNLSTGFKNTIETLHSFFEPNKFTFIETNLSDWNSIETIFQNNNFDAVIHFAASLIVPESVEEPLKYYLNNTANSANLIKLCNQYKVNKFIFSSTAAVYGEPSAEEVPVNEESKTAPINPYGHSKLMTEQILNDIETFDITWRYIDFEIAGLN